MEQWAQHLRAHGFKDVILSMDGERECGVLDGIRANEYVRVTFDTRFDRLYTYTNHVSERSPHLPKTDWYCGEVEPRTLTEAEITSAFASLTYRRSSA